MTTAASGPLGGSFPDVPTSDQDLVESGVRPRGVVSRLGDVAEHRELLINLTRREVKVRHKNSVLGVAWNLMNPLLHLTIFSVVFTFLLPSGIPRYALSLLSGMVIYDLFSSGVTAATQSVSANSPLVKKIWFPREILPVAAVLSNLVPFASRLAILLVGLAVFGQAPEWSMLWLVIPAIIITLTMAAGLGLLLAALNVFYRDVQHFLELAFLALFWFTPIIYTYDFVGDALNERIGDNTARLAMLNPLVPVVTTFRRVLYNPTNFAGDDLEPFTLLLQPTSWYLQNLAYSAVVAVVFLVAGLKVFARLEGSFAERL